MLLNPGTVLGGRYEIVEKIGSGGMAMVYRGKDLKLERYVTIKVLREEYVADEEFIARFRSEASAAGRLSHPNIVRVYDVGEDGEIQYIVMEYIHGDTLKTAIKKKAPFDSRSTINVAIQIASALSQAHKAHIVHRDIKPQNILVGTDGVVKVTDFGIARAAHASTMTTTANAAGSVHYFSPEQARGGYVDEKSDIYSLGITMFEMITGTLPFQGDNSVAIALKHINEELPDIKQYNPKCTHSLEGIIRKATMKKADERYTNIDLMLVDLVRARNEIHNNMGGKESEHNGGAAAVVAATTGMRMSRRAEAAMEERARVQENTNGSRTESPQTMQDETTLHTEATMQPVYRPRTQERIWQEEQNIPEGMQTRMADAEELAYIRMKNQETADNTEQAQSDEGDINTPLVSFERYEKKLKISKDDQYEGEYMATDGVRRSRRPKKKRRNPRKEEGYDNEYDRHTEKKVIIAAILTAIVIIGVISAIGINALGGFGSVGGKEKTISVPDFLGMSYEQAVKEAKSKGLQIVKEGEDYSSYYDEGYIFWQDVEEDTLVANKTKIGVKVSLGLVEQEMPDVEGDSEKSAKEAIIKLVGTSPEVEYEHDDKVKAGYVISQTPTSGTKIDATSHITLVISKGSEGSDVVVPDVQGDKENTAVHSLEAVGLIVGNISYVESDTVEKGLVITQTLAPNQEVAEGSVVNLVISSGKPAKVEEPTEPEKQEPEITEPQAPTQPTTPEESKPIDPPAPPTPTSSTQYFTINAPAGSGESVHVQIVKADANGTATVMDTTKNLSEFPFSIAVTGTGNGTVTAYMDGNVGFSESVNFSE